MPDFQYALSIKQPWATLLVYGLKSIEIRTWSVSKIRGDVYIHAGRVPDPRQEVWDRLPPTLLETARLSGGIIGVANLIDCRIYRTKKHFVSEVGLHRNDPSWYESPLYGFVFARPRVLPFRPLPGNTRFFRVPIIEESE